VEAPPLLPEHVVEVRRMNDFSKREKVGRINCLRDQRHLQCTSCAHTPHYTSIHSFTEHSCYHLTLLPGQASTLPSGL